MEAGTNDVAGGHGAKPGGGSNAKGGAGNGGVVECQACGTERADAEARGERGEVGCERAEIRGESLNARLVEQNEQMQRLVESGE